jgi:hypothetical protein
MLAYCSLNIVQCLNRALVLLLVSGSPNARLGRFIKPGFSRREHTSAIRRLSDTIATYLYQKKGAILVLYIQGRWNIWHDCNFMRSCPQDVKLRRLASRAIRSSPSHMMASVNKLRSRYECRHTVKKLDPMLTKSRVPVSIEQLFCLSIKGTGSGNDRSDLYPTDLGVCVVAVRSQCPARTTKTQKN